MSLPEKDYLAILEVITEFHKCKSLPDFKNTFHEQVLPLVDAQAGSYGFADPDFREIKTMDTIGYPEEDRIFHEILSSNNPLFSVSFDASRPVLAHDIDFPKEDFGKILDNFARENPQYHGEVKRHSNNFRRGMFVRDIPDFSASAGVHRSTDKIWSPRDLRVMELLRPHLFQTLKTIAWTQELKDYKSLAKAVADTPTAIALIRTDMVVGFNNSSFRDLFPIELGQRLPPELVNLIEQDSVIHSGSSDVDTAFIKQPYFIHPKGIFRVELYLLKGGGFEHQPHWLLKLKLPGDAYSKMILTLQEKGLTGREMETCLLVLDGMDNQEIADRFFISIPTVKTHISRIFNKFDVHSRTKLIRLLKKKP